MIHGELMPGFEVRDIDAGDVVIRAAIGGHGPPMLLLHGHPQTHLTWHKVAPALARRFTVVATDLRGYGDSGKPDGGPRHVAYSKREMAEDQVAVMRSLGHERFSVVAHDRGARVAHRMALDHVDAIEKLVLVDIAPTATMYARTDKAFATRYFWWFFLIQPFDLPERMIAGDVNGFLDAHIAGQVKTEGAVDPRVMSEYRRCYHDPAMRHAACEDYRASADIDLEHDAADGDRRVTAPLLVLWGGRGTVGALYIDCGHLVQEERPEAFLAALDAFL